MTSVITHSAGDMKPRVSIQLREWQRISPGQEGQGAALRTLSFGTDVSARSLASDLKRRGVVAVTEHRDGIHIEAGSFVGRLSVGPIDISIRPKIPWDRWITLIGYAFRVRDLLRTPALLMQRDDTALEDIVISALCDEVRSILRRGMHREYIRQRRRAPTLIGRVDFSRIAREGGIRSSSIPTRYTKRSHDFLLNRITVAGLRLAGTIAKDAGIRQRTLALAHQMEESVDSIPLSDNALKTARQQLNRMTNRYEGVLALVELLWSSRAITYEGDADQLDVAIPGFAIDMNRVWQRLLERVLTEWQNDISVHHEFPLRDVFTPNMEHPLRSGRIPLPRPDFAIMERGRPVAYLDAKYRDLWGQSFPRDMLYQLALYATAQGRGVTTVLYPSYADEAAEQRIDIRNPISGQLRGTIGLRPVGLALLERLIRTPYSARLARHRADLSTQLLAR